jgi:hypothetical protein
MRKPDIYTKVVLTVIAVALIKIAFVDIPIISEVKAELDRSDISYCWDLATIDKVSNNQWQIHTYC